MSEIRNFEIFFYNDLLICPDCSKNFKIHKQVYNIDGVPLYVLYEYDEFLETIQEEWTQVIDSLLEDIESGQALPNHVQDACKYCAYKSICRNLANEVEPKLRVEKEEE